jgi:uncharacterized protein YegL
LLFVEELEQLARLAAFRPDLRMIVGEDDSGWCFNWSTGTISIDGGRLKTESADFTRGLVLHESAHAAITRLQSIVPLALHQDRRVHVLLNVLEDCRIETWMQLRFPGCRPWVREYNDRLFAAALSADVQLLPAAQFLRGILSRWWFGKAAEPMGDEARQAVESVWPAVEQVVRALPPPPDTLGDLSLAYARSPVSRCYSADADIEPLDDLERAVRMAQFEMWGIVHQAILPVYRRLLPPEGKLGKLLQAYFSLVRNAMESCHIMGNPGVVHGPASHPGPSGQGGEEDEPELTATGQDAYLKSWQRQQAAIDRVAEALLRWFQAHGHIHYQEGQPWGSRLSLRAAMRFEADPRLYDRLWSRPLVPTRIDPHFALVIDRSASMEGARIEQTFHGIVLLCEVCRRVGVPLNVYAFGNRVQTLLRHDEPLSAGVQARLGALPQSARGGTNLAAALELVVTDLGQSPFRDRFAFVLSDGVPAREHWVRQQIDRLVQDGVSLVGLGLGPGTARLQEFFPVSRVNLAAGELPGALATLLVQSLQTK